MFERISVSVSDHSSRDLLSCVDNAMVLSEGKIVARVAGGAGTVRMIAELDSEYESIERAEG